MYTYELEWKRFDVDLSDVHRIMKSLVPGYIGMSANSKCQIHMTEEPSQTVKDRISQHWNSLNLAGEKAKIQHREKLERTVKYAKDNLPFVELTAMTVAEKKLFMGRDLDLQDKEALLQKYPNV